ncbi:MAG: DUF3179 domain-containing protein [Bacteroidota bacterium]
MLYKVISILSLSILLTLTSCGKTTSDEKQNEVIQDEVSLFLSFFSQPDPRKNSETIKTIKENWKSEYSTMVLEVTYLIRDPNLSFELITLLQDKTGKDFGYDFNEWYEWLWNQDQDIIEEYDAFKARLYKFIDPKFETYFSDRGESATIRLDEIRWGGVGQDGIPPLRGPKMTIASKASYLDDDNVVFGIEVNGDFRAYPKRILAWHEMFVDEVGGIPVAGVYCTLCGTVILYKTEFEGKNYQIGTSGFLYRSNKLMYDKETQSLWNTLWGKPVLGPLVVKGIELEHLSVVTTSWGEWKRRHPETLVLAEETGYKRDYGEGVAYKDYFSTDEIMFNTPFEDNRLKNKQEVLALRLPDYPGEQLAISTKFLKKRPIYTDKIGEQELLVLTDKSGANRVYENNGITFTDYDQNSTVTDLLGTTWKLEEDKLLASDGRELERLPYHRAFWFGWYAAFPESRLVK